MQRRIQRILPGLFVVLSASLLSLCARADTSPAAAGGGPDVQMNLRTWRHLASSVGSPILVHYNIAAPQDHGVAINLGAESEQWFTLSLTDSQGNSVTPLPPAGRTRTNDWWHSTYLPPYAYVDGGKCHEGDILINEYFLLDHLGTYHLQVQVHLPFLALGGMHGEPDYSRIQAATEALSKTETFDFVVAEAAPSNVGAIASRLLDAIYATDDRNDRMQLINALFSLPERAAGPIWQIATAAPTNGSPDMAENLMFFADALTRRHSVMASDLLVAMITPATDGQGVDSKLEQYVLVRLGDLYNGHDLALRRHIDDALDQAGIKQRPISHI